MGRDYETPDDYSHMFERNETYDDWVERQRDADKEEAAFDDREGGPEYEYEKWLHQCEMSEMEYEMDREAQDARADVIDNGRTEQ
jgi:hypothetical protein